MHLRVASRRTRSGREGLWAAKSVLGKSPGLLVLSMTVAIRVVVHRGASKDSQIIKVPPTLSGLIKVAASKLKDKTSKRLHYRATGSRVVDVSELRTGDVLTLCTEREGAALSAAAAKRAATAHAQAMRLALPPEIWDVILEFYLRDFRVRWYPAIEEKLRLLRLASGGDNDHLGTLLRCTYPITSTKPPSPRRAVAPEDAALARRACGAP